ADIEAMTLTNGVKQRAIVLANRLAGLVDNRAVRLRAKLSQEKLLNPDFADKTNALTVFFFRCGEAKLLGNLTDFWFFELANWHEAVLQCIFGHPIQEIGLVLVAVHASEELT